MKWLRLQKMVEELLFDVAGGGGCCLQWVLVAVCGEGFAGLLLGALG